MRQQAYWRATSRADAPVDRLEGLGRRQPVGSALGHGGFDLLFEARHAGFEKLIQVGAEDAKEFHPFQQRRGGIERFLQDPFIEGQPA